MQKSAPSSLKPVCAWMKGILILAEMLFFTQPTGYLLILLRSSVFPWGRTTFSIYDNTISHLLSNAKLANSHKPLLVRVKYAKIIHWCSSPLIENTIYSHCTVGKLKKKKKPTSQNATWHATHHDSVKFALEMLKTNPADIRLCFPGTPGSTDKQYSQTTARSSVPSGK